MEQSDTLVIRRWEDKANAADRYGFPTHTGFLDLHEQSLVRGLVTPHGIKAVMHGGYPDSERQMAIFVPDVFSESLPDELIPIRALRITENFTDGGKPTHRDYMGAILGLGISREKIGDIVLDDNAAWAFCDVDIAEYILDNLVEVKRSQVSVEQVISFDIDVKRKYETVKGTVASNRLDSLVKTAVHVSRTQAVDLIKGGKVFVDGRECLKTDSTVDVGNTLSIRGFGKFKLAEASARTKKDRIAVVFQKYI